MVMPLRTLAMAVASLWVSLAPVSGQQPSGSIRGVVYDKDFNSPLGAAQVLVVETGAKTQSAPQGNYVLSGVVPGTYTLVFSLKGYVRQVRSGIVVSPGRLTEADAWLAGDFTDMDEFIVQDILKLDAGSEAALLELRLKSPSLLDSIGKELMSRAGASDAAGALRLVAGATVKDGKSAVIRGLPDRYVSSQLNGVRLPSADSDKRAVELDQFPSAVIESLQVSKTFTPDQQGDASGGAVDIRVKGIPKVPFFLSFKLGTEHNDQVTGRSRFLSYRGGGVKFWGRDEKSRRIQTANLGANWDGAVGTREEQAPMSFKWSAATGGLIDLAGTVKLGGFASLFYKRDSSFHDNGTDDTWWVTTPGGGAMEPKASQGTAAPGNDFYTNFYDIEQGGTEVQWGGMATLGLETRRHHVGMLYLFTRTSEDKATIATDTRGKQYYYPGYDPGNSSSPGHGDTGSAPYVRQQTLEYTERKTSTFQVYGKHRLDLGWGGLLKMPEFSWILARSYADSYQPDKRQFGSEWTPEQVIIPNVLVLPAVYSPYKSDANFTLGNLQRVWKGVKETSDQISLDLKLPFKQWDKLNSTFQTGFFHDRVKRRYNQDSYSNFNDNSTSAGPFERKWSGVFPYEDHPITASEQDVDYKGGQEIMAVYGMVDLPLSDSVTLVGGVRFETTMIDIVNDPEADATWYPAGAPTQTTLSPGDADVATREESLLPSVGLIWRPLDSLTLRLAYSETVARQTFKELTPILQQEYQGAPIFIGNPELKMSSLKNYDARLDYTPYEGGLFSVSWFRKDIEDAIEYVQKIADFDYTTALNYPEGEMIGWELETRHRLGALTDVLEGFALGANATFIRSKVELTAGEQTEFAKTTLLVPMRTRKMTQTPERLYNFFLTFDAPTIGARFGLFYTIQGRTLLAGAGYSDNNFVPSLFAKEYDSLNLSFAKKVGTNTTLQFKVGNLTNPKIKTFYHSRYVPEDVTKTSFTKGVEFSVTLSTDF